MATTSKTPQPTKMRSLFLAKLKALQVKAVCERIYVQTARLVGWLNEIPSGSQRSRLDHLLSDCKRHQKNFSITTKQVSEGNEQCVLVFCILLELDRGDLISDFISYDFIDSKLPLDLATLRSRLRKHGSDSTLAEDINKGQWKYCPFRLEFRRKRFLPHEIILPICEKQAITNKGGTAHVHEILVQEEFVDSSIRSLMSQASRYDDSVHGPSYIFALKTYKDGNEGIFENETNAFSALQDNEGMIRYLLQYCHVEDDNEGKTSFNILLEYGQFDLHDYFYYHLPPVFEAEQVLFWKDIFLVADAVRQIHEFQHTGIGEATKYYGWHADIKPDNILNVQGQFKLADPGFACFEKISDLKQREDDATKYMGGTSTFGAPECGLGESVASDGEPRKPAYVTRSIDIWSLGCCLSVAATWVVFGPDGLEQFEQLRKDAIRAAMSDKSRAKPQLLDLGEGDYFHNGVGVTPEVLEWHNHLRDSLRLSDIVTEKVLELVEKKMLRGDPQARISAADLCRDLDRIIEVAGEAQKPPRGGAVKQAIERVEELKKKSQEDQAKLAPERKGSTTLLPTSSSHLDPRASRAASASLLGATLQTSHRSKAAGKPSRSVVVPSSRILNPQRNNQSSRMVVQSPLKESDIFRSPTQSTVDSPPLSTESSQEPAPFSPSSTFSASTPIHTRTGFSVMQTSIKKTRHTIPFSLSRLRKPKGDDFLRQFYVNRDLLFLIDNGASMLEHWAEVTERLDTLVRKALYIDKDGMDLKFTVGENKFNASNKPEAFSKEMARLDHRPMNGIETNMSQVLGSILADYLKKHVGRRKLTIIVLTDGKWRAMTNDFAVDQKIIEFSGHLRDRRSNNLEDDQRHVSIQFVQFGDDLKATYRLRRLDDDLKFKGVPDIVDTRASTADVKDILVGSLDESWDDTNSGSGHVSGSPEAIEGVDDQNNYTSQSRSSTRPNMTTEPSDLDIGEGISPQSPQRQDYPRHPGINQSRPSVAQFGSPATPLPSFNFKVDEHE